MRRNQLRDFLVGRHPIATIVLVSLCVLVAFFVLIQRGFVSLEALSKFVDMSFKAIAVLAGAIWALSRYFIERTDSRRVRIDHDVQFVSDFDVTPEASALCIFRLDIVNISKVQIREYQEFVELHGLYSEKGGVTHKLLYRWPESGTHPGGAIEPGAWGAINSAVPMPAATKAVRLYLEIHFIDGTRINWHKTFPVHSHYVASEPAA